MKKAIIALLFIILMSTPSFATEIVDVEVLGSHIDNPSIGGHFIQSFKTNSINALTKIEFKRSSNGDDITFKVMNNNNDILTTKTVDTRPYQVGEWFEVDIDDLVVAPEETYKIDINPGYNGGVVARDDNPYTDGGIILPTGSFWENYDLVMKVYGTGVDIGKPQITILNPENITYNTNIIQLNTLANENITKWEYSIDDNSNITFNPEDNVTFSEGYHKLTFYATDTTGLIGSKTSYFTIDSPIKIDIIFPGNNVYLVEDGILRMNISLSENSNYVRCEIDGIEDILNPKDWIYPNTLWELEKDLNPFSDTYHELVIYAEDSGNEVSSTVNFKFLISPIMYADVDGDGNLEIVNNSDNNITNGYEDFIDEDGSSTILKSFDQDSDGLLDFFIDTNGDNLPDVYWDPDDVVVSDIKIIDIDEDGIDDYIFDGNGNGKYNTWYNPSTEVSKELILIQLTSPESTIYNTKSVAIEYTFSNPDTCSYSLNSEERTEILNCSTTVLTLEDGSYSLNLIVKDTNGNYGLEVVNFIIKTIFPEIIPNNIPNNGGGGGGYTGGNKPQQPQEGKLIIMNPKRNIEIISGKEEVMEIPIQITGDYSELHNITAKIIGIPEDWYEVELIDKITKGSLENIKIKFSIPEDAEIEDENVILNIISSEGIINTLKLKLNIKTKEEITTSTDIIEEVKKEEVVDDTNPLTGLINLITGNPSIFLGLSASIFLIFVGWSSLKSKKRLIKNKNGKKKTETKEKPKEETRLKPKFVTRNDLQKVKIEIEKDKQPEKNNKDKTGKSE